MKRSCRRRWAREEDEGGHKSRIILFAEGCRYCDRIQPEEFLEEMYAPKAGHCSLSSSS